MSESRWLFKLQFKRITTKKALEPSMTPLIRIALVVLVVLLTIRILAPNLAERIKIVYVISAFALAISVGLFLYALLG